MAKDICVQLKFDSNGQTVLGQLTVSAKELQGAMRSIKSQSKSTFSSFVSGISASTGVLCCVGFIDVYAVHIC